MKRPHTRPRYGFNGITRMFSGNAGGHGSYASRESARTVRLLALRVGIVGAALLATVASAADLSQYRMFRLGSDLPTVATQLRMDVSQATVIHERPIVIQEIEWRPDMSLASSYTDPVRVVVLSFYNGELYRIFIAYDRAKTEGMSQDDMIGSLSESYGTATRPVANIRAGSLSEYTYTDNVKVLARWQDSQYAWNLIRSSAEPTFGLIAIVKRLDPLAQRAMVEGARLDITEGPQRERERVKREAEDERVKGEKARIVNKPNFRP